MRNKGILGTLAAFISVGVFLYKLSTWVPLVQEVAPGVFPDRDTAFFSCTESVREDMDEVLFEEFVDSADEEMCLKMPDWTARLTELKATYDRCPGPTDPQLIRFRLYEREMFGEYLLIMDMVRDCCDGKPNCDPDAAEGHLNRALELQKSMQELLDDYTANGR